MAGDNRLKGSALANATIDLDTKGIALSVGAALLSAGAKTSVLSSKTKGVKVRHAQIADPAASTLNVTSEFGFNVAAGVDPEGNSKGVTALLDAVGGTEYNSTTGKVGANAQAASSIYPVSDANGDIISDAGNGGERVWAIVTTPTRDTTGPYTARFFSGAFKSGSEVPYVMNQAFIPYCPKIFDLSDMPTFDEGDVVFFDGSVATVAPGDITDVQLSDTVQGKSINVERDRVNAQFEKGWTIGGAITASSIFSSSFDMAAISGYLDDGVYFSLGASPGELFPSAPANGQAQTSYYVIDAAGLLATRSGSAAAAVNPALPPDDAVLNAGDIVLYRFTLWSILNVADIFLFEDMRASVPGWYREIREEVAATTTCQPTYRPSASRLNGLTDISGSRLTPLMDIFVDGQRAIQVASGPVGPAQFTYIHDGTGDISAILPTITFGEDNSDKTVVLKYKTGKD